MANYNCIILGAGRINAHHFEENQHVMEEIFNERKTVIDKEKTNLNVRHRN